MNLRVISEKNSVTIKTTNGEIQRTMPGTPISVEILNTTYIKIG